MKVKGVSYDFGLSHRYEEEINRRTAAENEFVLLKKVRGRRFQGQGRG